MQINRSLNIPNIKWHWFCWKFHEEKLSLFIKTVN